MMGKAPEEELAPAARRRRLGWRGGHRGSQLVLRSGCSAEQEGKAFPALPCLHVGEKHEKS